MSIIYDALKKVEQTTQQQDPSKNNPAAPATPPPTPPTPAPAISLVIGVLVIAVLLWFGIPALFSARRPAKQKTAPQQSAQTAPIAAREEPLPAPPPVTARAVQPPPAPAAPAEKTAAPAAPGLFLNGIFFSEDQGYCIINNKVAKVGDVIEGSLITNITPDEVEVETGGVVTKYTTRLR